MYQPMDLAAQIESHHLIGCGASGVLFAYKLRKHLSDSEFVIYEKNHDVGGTWLENRYPVCACDIPSHAYQYNWAPNPEWNQFYSGSEELWQYFKRVAHDFNIMTNVRLRHRVSGAEWIETDARWRLSIVKDDGCLITDEGEFLIDASGVLNNWKWPKIHGLHNFKGTLIHSAQWDDSYDFTDKDIAVIGGGSSAVQIVPSLQPQVKSMKSFIRSPAWISDNYATKDAGSDGRNFQYSETQKQNFRENPDFYLQYRKDIEYELNSRFKFIIKGSKDQSEAVKVTTEDMRKRLAAKPHLIRQLVPSFAFGCRRPTPGNGYLEALASDNVDAVFDPIVTITPGGIQTTANVEHKFDAIVCATGFDISFKPRFPLFGHGGENLQDRWTRETPKSYMSLMVAGFPNYFTSLGPHSPVGHGSLIPAIEVIADYVLAVLQKVQRQRIRAVEVKQEAVNEFTQHTDEFMKRTAWSDGCSSWFKNGSVDGPVVAIWPGSRLTWFEALREPRFEDFEYTYETANRFQYFGNGFTQREIEGQDLTWYLDQADI
ncbi:uncharacterized protein N7498_000006 [Penicillium cinerascens]|uniref:FAD/NAD(P)-binding domain-containing protein n=1 Tax=Penicillium cinerascens TaxID=70096 RepID=A0A9W9TCP1_9EURO|nr:uncharacterized protein N7498_000006 [Penicillium cinerascens]KAJ5217907.1 hypothetical protein N7498_000006 [Penicillium cinerascens]